MTVTEGSASRGLADEAVEQIAPQDVDEASCAPRPMRADAVKNRQRILEAAEAVFAAEGVSVPIDLVAERAEVGVGTLYRHFPTKEALFEAIVTARIEALLELAQARLDSDEPGKALFWFLHEFARQASEKRDLFDAMMSAGIDVKSQCSADIVEMKRRVEVLIQRAVACGTVRSDVSTEDVMSLVVGASQSHGPSGDDHANLERMVDVICDGLRVRVPSRSTS